MASYLIANPKVEWEDVAVWSTNALKGKSLHSAGLCKLCFGATVYYLWRQRNDLMHGVIFPGQRKLLWLKLSGRLDRG
jgi:hypothetical protein